MSTDSGSPITPREPLSPELPPIRSIRIRRRRFAPPELTHFRSRLPADSDVVEFVVETYGDVPARAYGPALYVGDVEVDQSEKIDASTWRFLAFEPRRLREGEAITWGWMKDPKRSRQKTDYRFELSD